MTDDQIINPWVVKKSEQPNSSIDYTKIIEHFGCQKITDEIIREIEEITRKPVHHLIKRGLVFAHRDLYKILQIFKSKKQSFYLYTGRGPSSSSMHIGHAVPFLLCKYLQDVFNVPVVIQLTDDEKFLWKNLSYEDSQKFARENIKDIIAFGFDPLKTFIFTNTQSAHLFVENTLKIGRSISFKEASKVFGFDDSFSISQIEFPAKEIAPCFASSFKFLSFINKNDYCLVPAAIDQDPFFRLARDKAHIIKSHKPATIYSSFMPDLAGSEGKMSASDLSSSIFLSDDASTIKRKINKHAFSGGRDTLQEHRLLGGNCDVDISFQFLRYFLEDDILLTKISENYKTGELTSGEMKQECIRVLTLFIEEYQKRRNNITDEVLNQFLSIK